MHNHKNTFDSDDESELDKHAFEPKNWDEVAKPKPKSKHLRARKRQPTSKMNFFTSANIIDHTLFATLFSLFTDRKIALSSSVLKRSFISSLLEENPDGLHLFDAKMVFCTFIAF
ncbi:MAG: hypothetical protein HKM04_07675 [Legionellales bacterium]|nr:hypothetical protein [Legionellales bacterium]